MQVHEAPGVEQGSQLGLWELCGNYVGIISGILIADTILELFRNK